MYLEKSNLQQHYIMKRSLDIVIHMILYISRSDSIYSIYTEYLDSEGGDEIKCDLLFPRE